MDFNKLKQAIYQRAYERVTEDDLNIDELEAIARLAWNLKEEETPLILNTHEKGKDN